MKFWTHQALENLLFFQERQVIALQLEELGLLRACLYWKQEHQFVTSGLGF